MIDGMNERDIENGIISMEKCLDKLNDMKCYMIMLNKPDIGKYQEWDIEICMKWIQLLDNGRFIKYIDVLRNGFMSDGVKCKLLPEMTASDLRNEPFGIKDFQDRTDLIKYFKSLAKKNL